jgi:hypothetical protein
MNESENNRYSGEWPKGKTLDEFLEQLGFPSAAAFSRRIECSEKTAQNWRRGKPVTLTISQARRLDRELGKAGLTWDDVPDIFIPKDKSEKTESAPTA